MTEKICAKCQTSKPAEAFAKNPNCKDGRTAICKLCKYERTVEIRENKLNTAIIRDLLNWPAITQ